MEMRMINPWTWQTNFGYAQAVEVKQNQGTLYCAGQTAVNKNGEPVDGTMEEQMKLALHNLETVITAAGYDSKHIVRLNIYTTAISETFISWGTLVSWLLNQPACTLVEVKALAFPQLKIEIEATLVK